MEVRRCGVERLTPAVPEASGASTVSRAPATPEIPKTSKTPATPEAPNASGIPTTTPTILTPTTVITAAGRVGSRSDAEDVKRLAVMGLILLFATITSFAVCNMGVVKMITDLRARQESGCVDGVRAEESAGKGRRGGEGSW